MFNKKSLKLINLRTYLSWSWLVSINILIKTVDKILSTDSSKIVEHDNYINVINYMAPAKTVGRDICPDKTDDCAKSCLGWFSGFIGIVKTEKRLDGMNQARAYLVRKTVLFFRDREAFMLKLRKDLTRLDKRAQKLGKQLAVRLDGSSGLLKYWYVNQKLQHEFPSIKFYEYTKNLKLAVEGIEGVDLTFSHKPDKPEETEIALNNNVRVAVAFLGNKEEVKKLTEWRGKKVVNGDSSDYRFLDPKGVIIGLSLKQTIKSDMEEGFFESIG